MIYQDNKSFRINQLAYLSDKVQWLALALPGLVLYWLHNGLSFSQIVFLQGIAAFVVLLCELPSGILADRFQRNHIVAVGNFSIVIGCLIYSISINFEQFVIAETFISIGLACISGADTALIWDTCLELEDQNKAENMMTIGKFVMMASALFMMIIGGYLAIINLKYGFYFAAIGHLVVAILFIVSYEPSRTKQLHSHILWKKSIGLLGRKDILDIFATFLLLAVVLRIAFWAYIPKMENYNIDKQYYGYVLGIANGIAALSTIYFKFKNDIKKSDLLKYMVIGSIGAAIFIFDDSILILFIAIGIQQIARGLIRVSTSIMLNKSVESDIRASAESLLSSLSSSIYLVISWIINDLNSNIKDSMIINMVFVSILFGYYGVSSILYKPKIDNLIDKYEIVHETVHEII